MTPLQAFAAVVFNLLRSSGDKLTLKTVQAWINDHSDTERYGTGFSGNRLSRGPSSGFVEVIKRSATSGFTVTASVYLDPRQGAAATKTWSTSKIDSALEKYFGKNQRVRIDI